MKKLLLLFSLTLLSYIIHAQNNTVQIIAGCINCPAGGAIGDGLTDTSASFLGISGIAEDTSGNLYIWDRGHFRIRKIDAVTHIVTTIAGTGTPGFSGDGGPAVLAQLGAGWPTKNIGGICIDDNGSIYLPDYSNNRIRKIDQTTGIITTFAGGGVSYADGINALTARIKPVKAAFHDSCIYFSDSLGAIRRIGIVSGIISTYYTSSVPGALMDFTFDHNNNLYIYSINQHKVDKVDASGMITLFAGNGRGYSGDGGPAILAKMRGGWGITSDSVNNIYIGEENGLTRKINASTERINTLTGASTRSMNYLTYGSWNMYGLMNFTNCATPILANRLYDTSLGRPQLFIRKNGNYLVAQNHFVLVNKNTGIFIDKIVLKKNQTTLPCTTPDNRTYSIYGTIEGIPSTDSINITIDNTTTNLAYNSYVDSSGTHFYFGDTNTSIYSKTYSFPKEYITTIGYYTNTGIDGIILDKTTAKQNCNAHYGVFITSVDDSIITPLCADTTRVLVKIEGTTSDYFTGEPPVFETGDSVYIDMGDHNMNFAEHRYYNTTIDSLGNFSLYVMLIASPSMWGDGGYNGLYIDPIAYNSSGETEYPLAIAKYADIHDCSAPYNAYHALGRSSSDTLNCILPYTAEFSVYTMLYNSAILTDSLMYTIYFGDGADTTITLHKESNKYGRHTMEGNIHHIYTLPGTYVASMVVSDSTAIYNTESFTVTNSCSPLSGHFYKDANMNCVMDSGEVRLAYWPFAVVNNASGDTTYSWCDSVGHYALTMGDGISYTILPHHLADTSASGLSVSCPSSGYLTLTTTASSPVVENFGFSCAGAPSTVDMHISGWSWGVIPGDTGVLGIWASNDWGYMCDSLNSTVTLTLDPMLSYAGMWNGQEPTTISGSTLTWNFHTMANLLDFTANIKIECVTTATMGDYVHNTVHVNQASPISDPDSTNNTYTWSVPVTTSWDPNEKQVSPQGFGPLGYVPNGTPFTYTVHFQNTGTARARNITVNDTISEYLDISTLQVVSSSAPVLVYQDPGTRIIRFRFNDIFLPDSTTNPDGSNGNFIFNIYPYPNLPANTQIHNTVGIYFDYNPAVVTNTTTSTIEDTLHDITTSATEVCEGSSITLGNSLPGGVWSASNDHATVVDGVVTGVTAGIDTIYYSVYGGDQATQIVITVNPLPHAGTLAGATDFCESATTTITGALPGGTWSSSTVTTSVADGIVNGLTAGPGTVSYTVTNSCGTDIATWALTVNPLPDAGTLSSAPWVCVDDEVTLSSTVAGGIWSSADATIAISGATITGITAGSATVYYAYTNSCGTDIDTLTITVNPLPVSGTVSSASVICIGTTATLTATAPGGVWSSEAATATISGDVVTGVAVGVAPITYTVTNMCGSAYAVTSVAVESPMTPVISGPTAVCAGTAITMTGTAPGGTWSASGSATAMGSTVAGISAGTAIVSYSLSNSCGVATDTVLITVNPLPTAGTITGSATVCAGTTITLVSSVASGTWSSSTPAATVSDGIVSGVSSGATIVSYTVTNMCGSATDTMAMTVLALPDAGSITGYGVACAGSTISLTTTGTGGAWSSSSPAVTVSATGTVTGVSLGSAVISYSVSNSCSTAVDTMIFNVISLPDAGTITGTPSVCVGGSTTLTNSITGGEWISSTGDADVVDGVVTGINAGTVTIFYSVTNMCGNANDTMMVTIESVPILGSITGSTSICTGDTGLLVNPTTGGTWSSSAAGIVTIDATGTVQGVSAGSASISYTYSNNCGEDTATTTVTINSIPDAGALSGMPTICPGNSTSLTTTVAGGTWESGNTAVATVGSGIVWGIAEGSATIYYIVSNSCGSDTAMINITIAPISDCPDNVPVIITPSGISLYPNPNNGTFTISGYWADVNGNVQVQIINILGQVVYSENVVADAGNINALLQPTDLSAGNYMFKMDSDTGRVALRFTVRD